MSYPLQMSTTHHLTNRLHSREVLSPVHIAAIAYLRLVSYTVIHTHTLSYVHVLIVSARQSKDFQLVTNRADH